LGDVTDGSRELLPALAALPGHLFWRAQARVAAALVDVLPPGVDIHAYAALLALPGGVTRSQQSLAETISVSRTTMVKVAAELSAQGLVERVRNPEDRRSYALTRTQAGASAARAWQGHAHELEDAITASFTKSDREELHRLLVRVARADLAPDAPAQLMESIAFLISRIHARMHREFAAALAPLDLMPAQYGALTALQSLGPVSQVRLARCLGVSGAHVVQIVDDLEHRGLLERRRQTTDRRNQHLYLREGVDDVLEQATELGSRLADQRLEALSLRQRKRLLALLRQVVTATAVPRDAAAD
jgi:DNA-binding MarR family transcriptional regulator